MNRIRELREQRGWSADELAERCRPKTSGAQIRRLEVGARRLTEDWMRRIADALAVNPADLLESIAMAELRTELEPVDLDGLANIARALANHRQMRLYRTTAGNLLDSGLAPGKVFLADESTQATAQLKTGAIAVLELRPRNNPEQAFLVPRVFIAPDLFVTNRPGNNLALKLNDLSLEVKVVGVMVPDSIEDGH